MEVTVTTLVELASRDTSWSVAIFHFERKSLTKKNVWRKTIVRAHVCQVDEAKTLNSIVRVRQNNNQACRMQLAELLVGKGREHMVVMCLRVSN